MRTQINFLLSGLHLIQNEKNVQQGIQLLTTAALQGHVHSMMELGNLYDFGEVVDRNWLEAMKWLESAASLNHTPVPCHFSQTNRSNVFSFVGIEFACYIDISRLRNTKR